MRDMVILLELDSKVCRSMARKLRAEHIDCQILPAAATSADVLAKESLGLILAGGDSGEAAAIPDLAGLLGCGLPVLAMGDAALALAVHLGGSLGEKAEQASLYPVQYEGAENLFGETTASERYIPACRTMTLSAACHPIAQTEAGILGFRAAGKNVFGLAFLPENNDPDGTQLLLNFCKNVCGCTLWWSRQIAVNNALEEIRQVCQEGEALCAISGGVDSGVCAVLGHQAIGSRMRCLFIDTGLLRKGESDEVLALYRDTLGLNVERVDASQEILEVLKGVRSGKAKERIIHEMLSEIIQRETAAHGVTALLQGTNYTDTLDAPPAEPAQGIRILEPVRALFKDEIRRVGEDMQLPAEMINRQPFPGSGLALRVLSEVTEEKLAILREADAIFRREIEAAGQHKRLWQYYATLTDDPEPAVDRYVVILRAVQVIEGHMGVAARLPHDLLERVTEQILTQLPAVGRVLYDFTPSKSFARSGER